MPELAEYKDTDSQDNLVEFSDAAKIKILQRRIRICNTKALNHRKHSNLYNLLHYLIGFPQVILTLTLTYISEYDSCKNRTNLWGLGIGAFASALGLAVTFFNMKESAQRHRNSALLYEDLSNDTVTAIHQKADLILAETLFNEKMKLINIEEPNLCISYCCLKNGS